MRVVTVSQVRQSLYWAGGGPGAAGGPGEATLPLLGRLFHGIYAGLTGPDSTRNLVRPLEEADANLEGWKKRLRDHAYAWHVGPALAAHRSELGAHTREVLAFWEAVRALADWLAEILWAQEPTARRLEELRATLFEASERDVAQDILDPSWAEPVRIEGRLDALLRQTATGIRCVVELKTGRGAPEADLCQAALYRLLLEQEGREGPLAVVAFEPSRREHRFEPAQLREAERTLRDLIGRLAEVPRRGRPEARRGDAAPTPASAFGSATEAHLALGRKLISVLGELDIDLALDGAPVVGPSFLRFFAKPGARLRARQLHSISEDVWVRIPVDRPPFISIEAGRVVLDVQRPDRQDVSWARHVLPDLPAPGRGGSSRFPVGVAVDGSLLWADFAEPAACHLLVAGTTGSGKSEWLRAMLASVLSANTRETLRLLLIDPKRVAFKVFEGAPCLWRDVVYPDEQDMVAVLDDLIAEMARRYEAGISDLRTHNSSAAVPVPRIVCVCDEFADLLDGVDRKERRELELRIRRLGAKARAAGIHLVFATQRPSADVVNGTIRANLVARVALRVDSPLNSRLILERPGADALLGRGDLLFRSIGDPVRVQSPYVTEDELRALTGSGVPS